MIRGLKGKVFKVSDEHILVETPGGVIYKVKVPYPLLAKSEEGKDIMIHTYTYFGQNYIELYGFESEEQLKIFSILLEIPGIGPSMAIKILSDISIKELFDAVKSGNVNTLKRVKGLGTKKAEMIIFALRDVIWDQGDYEDENHVGEAIQALVSLGVDYVKARKLVSEAIRNGFMDTEDIIKFALQRKDKLP